MLSFLLMGKVRKISSMWEMKCQRLFMIHHPKDMSTHIIRNHLKMLIYRRWTMSQSDSQINPWFRKERGKNLRLTRLKKLSKKSTRLFRAKWASLKFWTSSWARWKKCENYNYIYFKWNSYQLQQFRLLFPPIWTSRILLEMV